MASALKLECALPGPGTTTLVPVVLTIVSRMRGCGCGETGDPLGMGLMGMPLVREDDDEMMLGKSSLRLAPAA